MKLQGLFLWAQNNGGFNIHYPIFISSSTFQIWRAMLLKAHGSWTQSSSWVPSDLRYSTISIFLQHTRPGKKSLNQVNIMVCYIIIIMQDLLKRVEVNKQNQKTGDDLTKKKWERQTWRLLASSLKWEKNLSASIPQILTNLIHWKFDLHFVLHCNVCKRDSCQDPGSGSPVDFSSMLLFD